VVIVKIHNVLNVIVHMQRKVLMNRLFVAVSNKIYNYFIDGSKKWELRGVCPNFNSKTVYTGRKVEVRSGYSIGQSLWGRIGRVYENKSLNKLLYYVNYKEIIPYVITEMGALNEINRIMGQKDSYILFEII
jgi:hypothetical protein